MAEAPRSSLRASQVETLRAVEKHETPVASTVAAEMVRWTGSTQRSLNRLVDSGHLLRQWDHRPGTGRQYSFYRLTNLGREVLEAEQ